MDKDNIFKSSKFHMDNGDVLHILIKDLVGEMPEISLVEEEDYYYVKNGGNDSLDGLSDATAWAHHPWMLGWTGTTVLVPGNTVCFKRGDTWENTTIDAPLMTVGQSGSPARYITTTSYGTGPLPLLHMGLDQAGMILKFYFSAFFGHFRVVGRENGPVHPWQGFENAGRMGN